MYYFSAPYFMYIFIAIALIFGLYHGFKNKNLKAKKILVFTLMIINLFQHLFKGYLYPHMWGQGFSGLNTAYNMCAFLIIATPFIYLFGSELWKNFICYVGAAAGIVAICVPYWFTVETAFSWEATRFYLCHILLILTSLLPALFGIYKINWRFSFKLPFLFYLALIVIIFNEIVCFVTGLFDGGEDLIAYLRSVNPCWAFGPFEGFEWVGDLSSAITPDTLLKNEVGEYIPILWYAIPIYIFISLGALALGAIFDKSRFNQDVIKVKSKIKILLKVDKK